MSVDLPGKVYNLLKRELIEEGLQPLEPDFYKTVINAMKTLKPESPLRENLWQTIRILFLLRLKKEVDILLRGETDKLKGIPQEEREVITKILETIEMEKSRPIAQQMAARPLVDALETWLDHGLRTDTEEFFICSGVRNGHLMRFWFCHNMYV